MVNYGQAWLHLAKYGYVWQHMVAAVVVVVVVVVVAVVAVVVVPVVVGGAHARNGYKILKLYMWSRMVIYGCLDSVRCTDICLHNGQIWLRVVT